MPPKKKPNRPSKSGFMQYVLELRDKSGKHFANMAEAVDYAGPRWQRMSREERIPYNEMAKLASNNATPGKYTSDGTSVDILEKEAQDKEQRERAMKAEIDKLIGDAKIVGFLDEEVFLLIHINHLLYSDVEAKWFVCEIAIASFTLRDGVNVDNVFHEIIYPGPVTTGYYNEAKIHSKETHKMVELVQSDDHPENQKQVFKDMIHFMEKFSKNNKMPILYCDAEYMDMIQHVLDMWSYQTRYQEPLKVYSLQYMFFVLRNAVSKIPSGIWASDSFSYSEINKDPFDYTPGICCEFHNIADVPNYCSKSIVVRYVYIICNCCCGDLKIDIVLGHHVPFHSKIKTEEDDGFVRVGKASFGNLAAYRELSDSYQSLDTRSQASSSISTLKAFGPNRTNAAANYARANAAASYAGPNATPNYAGPNAGANYAGAANNRPSSNIGRRTVSSTVSSFRSLRLDDDTSSQSSYEQQFPSLGKR